MIEKYFPTYQDAWRRAQQSGKSHQAGYILLTVLVMAMLLSSLGMIGAQVLINNSRFNLYQAQSAEALTCGTWPITTRITRTAATPR